LDERRGWRNAMRERKEYAITFETENEVHGGSKSALPQEGKTGNVV
jgi:deoxyhypusine synthase